MSRYIHYLNFAADYILPYHEILCKMKIDEHKDRMLIWVLRKKRGSFLLGRYKEFYENLPLLAGGVILLKILRGIIIKV